MLNFVQTYSAPLSHHFHLHSHPPGCTAHDCIYSDCFHTGNGMEIRKQYPLKAQRSISHTLIFQTIGSQIIHTTFLLEHLYVFYISKDEEAFRQKNIFYTFW